MTSKHKQASTGLSLVILKDPRDHPFSVIKAAVERHSIAGRKCYQKFSCSGCGQRLSIEKPNILYLKGVCPLCGVTTDIEAQGCNYMLEMHNATLDDLAKVVEEDCK